MLLPGDGREKVLALPQGEQGVGTDPAVPIGLLHPAHKSGLVRLPLAQQRVGHPGQRAESVRQNRQEQAPSKGRPRCPGPKAHEQGQPAACRVGVVYGVVGELGRHGSSSQQQQEKHRHSGCRQNRPQHPPGADVLPQGPLPGGAAVQHLHPLAQGGGGQHFGKVLLQGDLPPLQGKPQSHPGGGAVPVHGIGAVPGGGDADPHHLAPEFFPVPPATAPPQPRPGEDGKQQAQPQGQQAPLPHTLFLLTKGRR